MYIFKIDRNLTESWTRQHEDLDRIAAHNVKIDR
jgi:hypothetical protein